MEYYDGLALRTANAMGEHGIKREGKTLLDLDYVDTRPYPGGGGVNPSPEIFVRLTKA